MNGEYTNVVSYTWAPNRKLLAIETPEGKGRVSFKHVSKNQFEIVITYYFGHLLIGKMVWVTNPISTTKESCPLPVQSKLKEWYLVNDAYKEEEVDVE